MTTFPLRLLATGAVSVLTLTACGGTHEPVHIGYVEANWTYVSAPSAGILVEQSVREGDTVAAGDFIFQLDTTAEQASLSEAEARAEQASAEARNMETGARAPEIEQLRANLREAEARLELARNDHDRYLPLIDEGLETQSRGDAIEAELKAAEAAVESARRQIEVAALPAREDAREAAQSAAQSASAATERAAYLLGQRRILAPEDGRIEEVFYRPGEYVTPGLPVVALLPEGALKARFFVPEAELSQLELGDTVKVLADGQSQPVEAPVTFIAHTAEFAPPVIYSRDQREKLVFLVEADLPANSGFHPGLPVEVVW